MAGYKSYPEYKESGVEWLGEVPRHWKIKKLKFVAVVQPSNVDKKTEDNEEPVLLCNYTDVYKNEFIDSSLEFMKATATKTEIERFSVDVGDVIVTKDSESPDDISVPACVVEKVDGLICGYHLTQIKGRDIDGKYLFRLFQSLGFSAQFVVAANGVTRFGLPQYAISNAFTSIPPETEQQTIARFLDHKTAQIDALIAKKQTLLEKLAEKRTALISHAVTKGLDPNVKMKDSGVEWLGQVPEHWNVKRLKFLVSSPLKYGANETAELTDTEFPRYIRITDVNDDGSLKEETFRSLPPEAATDYLLEDGDILLARSGATVGKSFIYRPSWGVAAYAGYLIRARMSGELDADLCFYFLQSDIYWQWLNSIFIRATIQNVSAEKYANLWLPVPSKAEQGQIIDYLATQVGSIKMQASKAEDAIEKLKEYRSALITQAVTGKIDVRNVKIPESATKGQAA